MISISLMCLLVSVGDGDILKRTPYEFPFASHAEWLKEMNGRGLDDWSVIFGASDFERFRRQDKVRVEKIMYSSDGLGIAALLLTPKKQTEPLPVIIYNRGGNSKWSRIVFWEVLEMIRLAEQGYVVAASYLRGVGGSEGKSELGAGDIRDTFNLIKVIDGLKEADSKRIGMWGFSRGGVTTYMSLAQTDRIGAAALVAGSADATSGPRVSEFETHVYPGYLAGYEENRDEALRKISAIHWVEKMAETPLLLMHGTKDKRVRVVETLRMAERLYELGRSYRVVIYDGGSHSLLEHFVEVRREVDAWFGRHLSK